MSALVLYLPFCKSPMEIADDVFRHAREALPRAQKSIYVGVDSTIWTDAFKEEVRGLLQVRLDHLNVLRKRQGYTYRLIAYVRTSPQYPKRLGVWIFRGEDELKRVRAMLEDAA